MAEQSTETTEEVTVAPTQEEVWEKIMNPKPISKEAVQEGKSAQPKEDRQAYAPKLAEFVQAQAAPAGPSPLEERLARIEEFLAPKAEPQEPDVYAELTALRQELTRRDEEARENATKAERDAQLNVHREGVVSYLRSSDAYPGLVALGQEENVFNTLFQRLESGESVSEDDVAQEAETKLRSIFDKLSAVYGAKSKEPAPEPESLPSETKTLTPDLSSYEGGLDRDTLVKELGLKNAQAAVWDRMFTKE